MLNLNTNLYARYGVDSNNVAKVSAQILNNSKSNEVQVKSIDYSKFNRANLGIDLYSSKTDVDLQKQIALTQAGLYAQSVNVAKLNSFAAQNLYSARAVERNVELTQSINNNEYFEAPDKIENSNNPIKLFETSDKNANSSNSFNPFKNDDNESSEKSEKSIELIA